MTPSPTAPGSLLRVPGYATLICARATSVLGSALARVALAFAILELPGASPGRLSLTQASLVLPQVLFVLVGGVFADRFRRTRLMVVSDLIGAVANAALAAMVLTRHAPLPALCLVTAAAGTGTALFGPAMTGLLPLLVPDGFLQRANATLRLMQNGAALAGLGLAGAFVAVVGPGWALAANGASFLVSALLVGRLQVTARPPARASGLRQLREGWREFTAHQWLWVVVAQFAFLVAGLGAFTGVLGPLAVRDGSGGPRAWAVITGAQALGSLLGAGLALRLRVRRPMLVAVLMLPPLSLPPLMLAVGAPLWTVAGTSFVCGVSTDVFATLWGTTMQREIPEEMLGRVSSYDWLGSLAFAPLGILAAGPLAAAAGVRTSLLACAALVLAAALAGLLSPSVRRLRTRPAPRTDPLEETGVPA